MMSMFDSPTPKSYILRKSWILGMRFKSLVKIITLWDSHHDSINEKYTINRPIIVIFIFK